MTAIDRAREIVIWHIVVTTLPKILERDARRIQELGLFTAYVLQIKNLQPLIESEQREVRALLRTGHIKIIGLQTKGGIHCRYTVQGYEQVIEMPPSVIKAACDQHLQRVMGLADENTK